MTSSPLFGGVIATALLCTGLANAACDPAKPGPVWVFPADGATDVPTNTAIWMIVEQTDSATLTLDDTVLTKSATTGPERHKWVGHGLLAPRTTYRLALEQTALFEFEHYRTETTFTTGDGPLPSAPEEPVVASAAFALSESWMDSSFPPVPLSCLSIAFAQDCYDQGDLGWISVVTPVRPAFWTSDSDGGGVGYAVVWPGECGAPHLIDMSSEARRPLYPCRTLTAMDGAGQPMGSKRFCVPDSSASTEDGGPSCQASSGDVPTMPLTLISGLLLGAWIWVRARVQTLKRRE